MLVELGLVEQRLKAVNEVLDGATVTDVAMRNGVTRQTVHTWLRRYASSGVAGLVDKTSKPESYAVRPFVDLLLAVPTVRPRSVRPR
jgi:transposase-like protein